MQFDPPLQPAILLKRYKRFLADVVTPDGRELAVAIYVTGQGSKPARDARIAAICLGHGVEELWTCDRDFGRYPDLKTRDPLIPSLHEPVVRAYAGRR